MCKQYCGHCHECGCVLQLTLDQREFCPICRTICNYTSHGYDNDQDRKTACPERLVRTGQAVRFENNVLARQSRMFAGLDCLPGQQDLFNA